MKIHARMTVELEVTDAEKLSLIDYAVNGCIDSNVDHIMETLKMMVNSGNYEPGYIPGSWLRCDILADDPDYERRTGNMVTSCDIEL